MDDNPVVGEKIENTLINYRFFNFVNGIDIPNFINSLPITQTLINTFNRYGSFRLNAILTAEMIRGNANERILAYFHLNRPFLIQGIN